MDEQYAHVIARWEGIIDAPAEDVWALLTDWGAMLTWWGNLVEGEGMSVESVHLEGGKSDIPRTRVLTRANAAGAGLPLLNRETLIHEDPVARRIYYNADNEVIAGIRNYIATTSVDHIGPKSSRMVFSSTFDVREGADPSSVRAIMESIYDGICNGFRRYFEKNAVR